MKYGIWLLAAGIVALIAACSSDDGTPPSSGTGGSTQAPDASGWHRISGRSNACEGVAPNSSSDCDACRSTACCTEARACFADPDCAIWLACEDACAPDDSVCVTGCWKNNPAPPAKAAYAACKQRYCGEACGVQECSGKSYGYQDTFDGACGACRREHCCQESSTCFEDPDCTEAMECFASCPDVACMLSKCNDKAHQQYLSKIAPDWACRNRYCYAECEQAKTDDCSVAFGYGDACGTCVHDSCCAETKACSDDVDCIEHQICNWTCGSDAACKTACDAAHWIGGGLDWVRRYCMNRSCGKSCDATGPGTCGDFRGVTDACKTCMDQKCCAEGDACGRDASCAGIHICVDACGADSKCQEKCKKTASAAGLSAYQNLLTCRSMECPAECSP